MKIDLGFMVSVLPVVPAQTTVSCDLEGEVEHIILRAPLRNKCPIVSLSSVGSLLGAFWWLSLQNAADFICDATLPLLMPDKVVVKEGPKDRGIFAILIYRTSTSSGCLRPSQAYKVLFTYIAST